MRKGCPRRNVGGATTSIGTFRFTTLSQIMIPVPSKLAEIHKEDEDEFQHGAAALCPTCFTDGVKMYFTVESASSVATDIII